MYEIMIKQGEQDIRDFASTKRKAVKLIARETGLSQRAVAKEIQAQTNSTVHLDNQGIRINVWFS